MDKLIKKFYTMISNDIAIDLGTSNTLVYIKKYGIIINEPSVVAINQKTGQVVAVGSQAKQMLGRTPAHIEAIRPLIEGVISDFEVTEEMLAYFLNKTQKLAPKILQPRVIIGVPSGITNVETRAVRDAVMGAGARTVRIIEEPMSAAIGIGLPIKDPLGSMVIDIGGGNTDIAVISLGGIVQAKNVRVAGDKFNEDIASYIRNEFKIVVGDRTAEDIKIAIGSVTPGEESREVPVRGRDLITGLPREVVLTDSDIREAITPSIELLIESVKEVLERTPPEVLSDVMVRGIVLVGGGSVISGLSDLLYSHLKIPIHVADDPMTAVVRGMGIVSEDMDTYSDILLDENDDTSPTT